MDVLSKGTGAFAPGQTCQVHPLACAAALEVQRIVSERVPRGEGGDIRGRGTFLGRCISQTQAYQRVIGSD